MRKRNIGRVDRRPSGDITSRAIRALKARGLTATVWKMGGNITAAGLAKRHVPKDVHLGIGADWTGGTEAVLFVGWDNASDVHYDGEAEQDARARLEKACEGTPARIEEGDDDTIVVAGPLADLVEIAVRFVKVRWE